MVFAATVVAAGCYRGSASEGEKPTPSIKQADVGDASTAARRFFRALAGRDATALRTMLDREVKLVAIEFASDACRQGFGNLQTVATAQLDGLARCLAEREPNISNEAKPTVVRRDQRWNAELDAVCETYNLELAVKPDGAFAVAAISAAVTCDGVVGGVIGGDAAGTMGPPPPRDR
jgi:hypothetical protein